MNDVGYAKLEERPDLRFKGWRPPMWMVVLAVVIWSGAAAFALLRPASYKVEATLAVVQEAIFESSIGFSGSGGLSAALGLGSDTNATMADIALGSLLSNRMLMRFVEQENLLPELFPDDYDPTTETWDPSEVDRPYNALDGAEELRLRLDVSSDPQYSLMHVSLRGEDRESIAVWLNSYLEMVDRVLRADERRRVESTIAFVEDQLARRADRDTRLRLIQVLQHSLAQQSLLSGDSGFIIRIVDPAVAPNPEDMAFSRPLILALGLVAGLVIPAALFLLLRGFRFRLEA